MRTCAFRLALQSGVVLISLTATACGLSACGNSDNAEPSSTQTSLPNKGDRDFSSTSSESSALKSPTAENVTEAFQDQLPADVAGSPGDTEPAVNAQNIISTKSANPGKPAQPDTQPENDPSAPSAPGGQQAPDVQQVPSPLQQQPVEEPPAPDPVTPEEDNSAEANLQVIDPNMPNIPSPQPGSR